METALFRSSMADVIRKLRETLIKQGFLIENFDEQNKVVMAYQNGNWYRTPKHILFELSSLDRSVTRIDVTASIESKKKKRREAEEVIEEKIVSIMYSNF